MIGCPLHRPTAPRPTTTPATTPSQASFVASIKDALAAVGQVGAGAEGGEGGEVGEARPSKRAKVSSDQAVAEGAPKAQTKRMETVEWQPHANAEAWEMKSVAGSEQVYQAGPWFVDVRNSVMGE